MARRKEEIKEGEDQQGKEVKKDLLKATLDSLEKDYGKGSVITAGFKPSKYDVIPTGSYSLNIATGVNGWAKGKVVEFFGWESSGKSTGTLEAIAQAQVLGDTCALIDGEHSFDPTYAKSIGVDVDKLIISQPDNGEQGYDTAIRLMETGRVGLVVIDSQTSLRPQKEIEGEVGASNLGLHARLMSEVMPKIVRAAAKNNVLVIIISQLREKIGVMFGCVHGETLVNFVDGRSISIKKVVEEKIKGQVWTYNEKLKSIEAKEIVGWHNNGIVENNKDFLHFETTSIENGARFGFTLTPDHEVMTSQGWRKAKQLISGDKILSKYHKYLNDSQLEFLKGMLVGDSTIAIRASNTACIKLQDKNNPEYIQWKIKQLNIPFKKIKNQYISNFNYQLAKIKKEILNRNPLKVFSNNYISDLALSIWIMDDGHYKKSHNSYQISIKRFKYNLELLEKIKKLFTRNGLPCEYNKEGTFNFTVEISRVIANRIKKYIPKCMQYKLPSIIIGEGDTYILNTNNNSEVKEIPEYVKIVGIREASKKQMRLKHKYDISIEDNHNYMVGGINNGIIIHNSPETTNGGHALKFYAHVRARWSKSPVEIGGVMTLNRTKVKIVKNKLAPPFKIAEFDVIYGVGIDRFSELIGVAVDLGIIQKSGSWFSYNGVQIGQGKEAVKQFLTDNPEVNKEIGDKVAEKVAFGNLETISTVKQGEVEVEDTSVE